MKSLSPHTPGSPLFFSQCDNQVRTVQGGDPAACPDTKDDCQEPQMPGGPEVAEGRWRLLGGFLKSWRHHGKFWLSNS